MQFYFLMLIGMSAVAPGFSLSRGLGGPSTGTAPTTTLLNELRFGSLFGWHFGREILMRDLVFVESNEGYDAPRNPTKDGS